MNDDATLLRRYAETGSDAAFTELVQRHINLVYGAALRRTSGDAHRAADVAQQVFIALARDARRLSGHTVLAAWLHTATRNAALNLMTSEKRRQARELAAEALAPAASEPPLDWAQLRPVIDAAIDELPESDRAAVVLRFLDQRAFAEIGAVLRVSEDAARMRTERALDKLRVALSRRGITSTGAALGALVGSQPILAAPAGLAASIATHALATLGTSAVAVGTTAVLSAMSLKLVATVSLTAVAAFGTGAYFGFSRSIDATPPVPIETPQHSKTIAALRAENQSLQQQVAQLNASLTTARAAATAAAKPVSPVVAERPKTDAEARQLLRISQKKAVTNNLRQLRAAIDQFYFENGRGPASLEEIVGERKYVRQLNSVNGESYANIALGKKEVLTVVMADGEVVSYDSSAPPPPPAPRTAEMARADELTQRIRPAMDKAIQAYRAANPGKEPTTPEVIIPYFATPQEGADFVEVIEAQKAAQRSRNP